MNIEQYTVKKRVAFQTLGCKLNFSETSYIAGKFDTTLFDIVSHKAVADYYIINSCLVTATAEKKCRTAIRQAKHRNPDAKVAVIGCMSQLRVEKLALMKEVDIVLGTANKFDIQEVLANIPDTKENKCLAIVPELTKHTDFNASYSFGDRTRSFLKIQDGCDNFCSYCTVPYARGRSRSGTIAEMVALANETAAKGFKEIVLTGVNAGDFGKHHGTSLIQLLKSLTPVDGIERIRLSSIEPDLLNDEIIQWVALQKKMMPHFHLPLQNGSDTILKAMNRKYSTAFFREQVKKIKETIPDACIACDVIIGFPGETDDHFNETLNFLDALPISYIHSFTYSDRPGTHAYSIYPKISNIIKKERSIRIHHLSEKKKMEFYTQCTGQLRPVLFECDNNNGIISGFTDNYIRAKTTYDSERCNKIKSVLLSTIDTDGIFIAKL